MQHHRRILAHRIEHHRPLGLGDHLAHDVDALRLELLEMGEAAAKFRLGVHQAATLSIGMMGDPIAVRWRATRPMMTVAGAPAGSVSASAAICEMGPETCCCSGRVAEATATAGDRKSTRLNSSH